MYNKNSGFYAADNGKRTVYMAGRRSALFSGLTDAYYRVCRKNERSDNVDEKKRAKIIRVCRVIALIMAVMIVLGVIFQPMFR